MAWRSDLFSPIALDMWPDQSVVVVVVGDDDDKLFSFCLVSTK